MIQKNGFTLIELLIYIAIAGVTIFTISIFFSSLIVLQVKNQNIAEVEHQGKQAMQLITQTIRNSQSVNSPSLGNNSTSLSLQTYNSSLNPTVFDLSSGMLRMTENGNSSFVTNSKVAISNLSFQNLGLNGTQGSIRITFTVNYGGNSNIYQYHYGQTFIGTASLRPH